MAWTVHRVTGAILFVGLAMHFYVMHFTGTEALAYEAVARRLADPFWIIFNIAFLLSAIYHGFYGLWGIATEYLRNEALLTTTKGVLLGTSALLVGVGIYILAI